MFLYCRGCWCLAVIPYRKDLKNNSDVLFQRIGYHIYTYIQECYNSSSIKGMSAQICSQR